MAYESNTANIVTDLNVDPYYDDFDETKNFHRILFRPGAAVQARELTQSQTITQNQIAAARMISKMIPLKFDCEI